MRIHTYSPILTHIHTHIYIYTLYSVQRFLQVANKKIIKTTAQVCSDFLLNISLPIPVSSPPWAITSHALIWARNARPNSEYPMVALDDSSPFQNLWYALYSTGNTITGSSNGTRPSFAIVSLTAGSDKGNTELISLWLELWKIYCQDYAVDFFLVRELLLLDRHASWSRLGVLRAFVPHYDYVMWVDTDVFSKDVNCRFDVRKFVQSYFSENKYFLGISDQFDVFNGGIYILKYASLLIKAIDLWYDTLPKYQNADSPRMLKEKNIIEAKRLSLMHIKVDKTQRWYTILGWGEIN